MQPPNFKISTGKIWIAQRNSAISFYWSKWSFPLADFIHSSCEMKSIDRCRFIDADRQHRSWVIALMVIIMVSYHYVLSIYHGIMIIKSHSSFHYCCQIDPYVRAFFCSSSSIRFVLAVDQSEESIRSNKNRAWNYGIQKENQ